MQIHRHEAKALLALLDDPRVAAIERGSLPSTHYRGAPAGYAVRTLVGRKLARFAYPDAYPPPPPTPPCVGVPKE